MMNNEKEVVMFYEYGVLYGKMSLKDTQTLSQTVICFGSRLSYFFKVNVQKHPSMNYLGKY